MIIMILENVTTGLRGELTRWLIEPKSGVYVGDVSARIRDLLWEKCNEKKRGGGIIQIWNTNNEQNFNIRMTGNTDREIVDMEGINLIRIPGEIDKAKRLKNMSEDL